MLMEITKNAARAFPLTRSLYHARRRRRRYNPVTDEPDYIRGVFARHRAAIERYRPIRGRLLEIGPGGNLGVSGLFVSSGAEEAVAIDVEPLLEAGHMPAAELGLERATLSKIRYECPCAIETAPFPDESFDMVVSHASFEHFFDPFAAVANITRILTPGAITSHEIDLRDHRNFDQPLEFLKYGDFSWELRTSHKAGRENRWRTSDYLSAFNTCGLEVLECTPVEKLEVTISMRAKFASRFRDKTLEDLGILVLFLVARKPPR